MSNNEITINKDNSGYNKLMNLIKEEIKVENEEKNKEDSMNTHKVNQNLTDSKNNNFIKNEDKLPKNNENIFNSRISHHSNNYVQKSQKTEQFHKSKISTEENNIDENMVDIPKQSLVRPKEYKGIKNENIIFTPVADYKVGNIISDSKYNYFFILIMPKQLIDLIKITVYVKQKIFYSGKIESQSYYIIYELNFLKEKVEKKFEEDINYILVQVPVEKNTEKLNITMERSETEEYYMSDISQRIKANNCFFLNNIFYAMKNYNLTENQIFSFYLEYFFDEDNKKE